jgi:hypothetical protein
MEQPENEEYGTGRRRGFGPEGEDMEQAEGEDMEQAEGKDMEQPEGEDMEQAEGYMDKAMVRI